MLYQLFEYSKERKRKFPMGSSFVLLYSLSELSLQVGLKRLKKVDPNIKAITEIVGTEPKFNSRTCTLFPGSQEDAEAFYKT